MHFQQQFDFFEFFFMSYFCLFKANFVGAPVDPELFSPPVILEGLFSNMSLIFSKLTE